MNLEKNIVSEIKKVVENIDPSAEIILYGSRARGDFNKESDWDLLILLPYKTSLKVEQKFRHQLFYIELEYNLAISTLVKSKKDWQGKLQSIPLYHGIKNEGITL